MPERSIHQCSKPGCHTLTRETYCDRHRQDIPDDRGTASQRGYDSKWRKFREAYLAKSEHKLCALRLDSGCTIVADCIDHIIPHNGNQRLFWDEKNMQPACVHCNSVKGNRILDHPPGSKSFEWADETGGELNCDKTS